MQDRATSAAASRITHLDKASRVLQETCGPLSAYLAMQHREAALMTKSDTEASNECPACGTLCLPLADPDTHETATEVICSACENRISTHASRLVQNDAGPSSTRPASTKPPIDFMTDRSDKVVGAPDKDMVLPALDAVATATIKPAMSSQKRIQPRKQRGGLQAMLGKQKLQADTKSGGLDLLDFLKRP